MGVTKVKGLSAEIEELPGKSLACCFPEPPTFSHYSVIASLCCERTNPLLSA